MNRAKAEKIREDYEVDPNDYDTQKDYEMAVAFHNRRMGQEADADAKADEVEDMWAEYEHDWLRTYYRKAYRFSPYPQDAARYFRNDAEADYEEDARSVTRAVQALTD